MDISYRENYIVFVNPNQGRRTACCLRVLRRFPSSFFLHVFLDKGWCIESVPWLPVIFEPKYSLITVLMFHNERLPRVFNKSQKKSPQLISQLSRRHSRTHVHPTSEHFFVVIGCKHWSHFIRSINSYLSSIGSDSVLWLLILKLFGKFKHWPTDGSETIVL